jgi:hypothetical protein
MTEKISAENVKTAITYFYLMSFCPPEHMQDFHEIGAPLRQGLAEKAGLSEEEFLAQVTPEACHRMLAFHQDTREPDKETEARLTALAMEAHKGPEEAAAYQEEMAKMAEMPERAKADNRLHRKKGCAFCERPCHYGYFSLISDPQYPKLLKMLHMENEKAPGERDAVQVLWSFSIEHLWGPLELPKGYISVEHLGNMAYCLLLLGMAKSRFALPEKQILAFQEANQKLIGSRPEAK